MKSKFKKIATLIVAALGSACIAGGVSGCVIKSVAVEEPDNVVITKVAPPDDGSLPTAHSCAENLAYINYVFDHQQQYHSYSNGVTLASIATQTTRTFRDYKDGVLVTTDLTYSSMIKNSTQTCTVLEGKNGESEVYFRAGDAPASNGVYPTDLNWDEEAPKFFSVHSYHYTYGLLPNELFNYIINEDTLISSDEVVVNGDGTYSQSFVLDPVASTYYYQYGMKTRGGLAAYPTFQSIKFTVTFDEGWQILSSVMNEVAMVNKGILVESKSEFTCDYFYGEDHFDQEHFNYYDSYYRQYVGDETLTGGDEEDENAPLDVASVLSNGFSKIMNGGEQFEITANLGRNTYSGFIWLTLDLEDIASSLALKVSLGKDFKNQTLYAEYAAGELSVYYGQNFGMNANLAAVKLEAQRFEQLINEIVGAITGGNTQSGATAYAAGETQTEESDPLTALMGCMKLEQDNDTAQLSLVTDDLLGLGIGIDAKLIFGVNGRSVLFRNAEVGGIKIGGQELDLSLGLHTTTAPVIDRQTLGTEANLADYVADVYSLLSSDLLKVDLKLDGTKDTVNVSALKNVNAEVTAYIDISEVTVGAEARVSYNFNGAPISAAVKILYDYTAGSGDYGNAVLMLTELNGAKCDVKLYCNVSELVSALSDLLTLGGGQMSVGTDNLVGMLNSALSVNFSNLLNNMYADKTQIKIGVSVDTVMEMLGVDVGVKFGSCTLCYNRGEDVHGGNLTASLPAIGFSLSVCGEDGEIEAIDKTDCLDLTYVLNDVLALAQADLFEVKLSLDGSKEGVTLNEIKDLTADLTAYVNLNGISVSADANVAYTYNNNKISAKLSAWFDQQTNKIALYLSEVMGAKVELKLYCNVDDLLTGITEILDFAGVKKDGETKQTNIELTSILGQVLSADFSKLIPVLETNANGLNISANVDEIVKLFGVEKSLNLGNVNLAYLHGEEPKLTAAAPALGLSVEICGASGEIVIPETDEYLDIAYVIDDVLALAKADLFEVKLSLDGSKEGVTLNEIKDLQTDLTAYVNLNGISVSADVNVAYTYNNNKISAKLSAWYDQQTNKIALYLSEVMGAPVELKLYCNIDDLVNGITKILDFAGVKLSDDSAENEKAKLDLTTVLNDVLSADFSKLIPVLETNANGLNISANVDEIIKLFGVEKSFNLGNVDLAYLHGEEPKLTAGAPALGLSVEICGAEGEIAIPETDEYLDIAYVIDDVLALAKSDLFEVKLSLDGSKEGVTLNEFKDLQADLTVYVNLNGISVSADADVSYKVAEDKTISAKLSVWYDRGTEGYGSAVVSLKEINGVETAINVRCDISELVTAIKSLLKRANVELNSLSTEESDKTADLLGGMLTDLLNADFTKLIPEFATTKNGLGLSLNVDETLSLFGVNAGVSFGNLKLTYLHGEECEIFAEMPALGLRIDLDGATGKLTPPDQSNCLDLVDLVDTVNAVWEQVDGIINEKSLNFNISKTNTFLAMDGIVIGFGGRGEINWNKGKEFVALDLAMSITDIDEEASGIPDEAAVKVIYDKNADDSKPLVRLAINNVGLDIYQKDIDSVNSTFGTIYNKVKELLGIVETQPEGDKPEEGTQTTTDTVPDSTAPVVKENKEGNKKSSAKDTLMGAIFKVLASDKWVKFLNDLTLTSNGKSVALSYLTDNAAHINIGADNNIRLYYDGSFGSKNDNMSGIFGGNRFALAGEVTVSAVVGTITEDLNDYFDAVNKSTAKNEKSTFMRLAYDFLFEGISCFSVENILGSDTYSVNFMLDGNKCNIDALEDVNIKADIYVTGAKGEHGKLAEGFLDINAAGIVIKLNVITERTASGTNFYIELNRIMDVVLNLKILATQDSLYKTLEALINAVNKTDVIDFVSRFMSSGTPTDGKDKVTDGAAYDKASGANGDKVLTDDTVSKIASLVEHIVNFNFSDAFIATSESGEFEVDGVLDATIDLDNIVTQLGIEQVGFGELGSARVVINHNDHSMTTYGTTTVVDDKGVEKVENWISLTSKLIEAKDYSSLKKEDYISIEFLPDLLGDIVNFATNDNGEIYDSFTFSGSITASINIVVATINANIDISTLTVSVGENGLSVSGILHIKKISALSIVTIPEATVGITISNGYITLAKGLTSTPEYKIMTMEYFLDHMLTKEGSVLEWWLDVSGWSTLISVINKAAGDINISSGLTTPEDIYLYNKKAESGAATEISMYDYVDSLRVIVNGKQTACFGDYSGFEKQLNVSDNYYGFALNGGKISGGALNKLYAAITRDNEVGINGVKAYVSIDGGSLEEMVKVNVNLTYEEGLTSANDFKIGDSLANSGVRAANLYDFAVAEAGGADKIDFGHNEKKSGYDEIFGCFTTSDKSYDYSHMLYTHTLTIVDLDGTVRTIKVRNGSTVYFYDNNSAVYTDNTKAFRLLYSTNEDELTGASMVMTQDTTVYALKRESVKVIMHSGNAEYEIASFIGDSVPVAVKGLESLEVPYYEDGTLVGADDKVSAAQTLHIYGTFVQSVVTVNFVDYKFTYDQATKSGSYTAVGRAAGFNSYYCTNGNTLVLESEINGYPVKAIAAEAFANTEGYSIRNVVVPASVTSVGEKAFLDNVGMQSAVFLAESVTFGGSSGEKEDANTTPFYGCSKDAGGNSTDLIVYYNTIVFEGSTSNKYWTKFRRSGSGAIYDRYYIGVDPNGYQFVDYDHAGGGAIYPAGTWQYVSAEVNLDLSGIPSTKLNGDSVENFLSQYYPFVTTTEFVGSVKAAEIESALEVYLAQFDSVKSGVIYKCSFIASYEKNGNFTTATYSIGFTLAAKITVVSNYDCQYYGVSVKANAPTEIKIPVNDLENLAVPTDSVHILSGMEKQEQEDGTVVVNLTWREKYKYSFKYTISGSGTRYNDTLAGANNAYAIKTDNSFEVIEGQQITFERSADKHVLKIYVDGTVKTTVTLNKFTFGYYSWKDQGDNDYSSITVNSNQSRTFKY